MIWLSLKLRMHTWSLLFKRKEKPPLMNCVAFFERNIRSGRDHSMEMARHDDERVEKGPSLTALVEYGSPKRFCGSNDLEKASALRRESGHQIRPSFLWRKPHPASIKERPVAKATVIGGLRSGA